MDALDAVDAHALGDQPAVSNGRGIVARLVRVEVASAHAGGPFHDDLPEAWRRILDLHERCAPISWKYEAFHDQLSINGPRDPSDIAPKNALCPADRHASLMPGSFRPALRA
jgi:hypothetical protein